ncbi:outer membrane beta-barrel protein [Spirosoma validum]|uniref:Outer membrane beta-barrel protein n=1 Tax=Spirosoma validum TaxID=2771355 RepID=A0A927B9J1_9BACT|nr:outer membrane beta-barrel protein [Spirosoma validum]MBD2757666.1 outer membrane beta-barrel protein [Spirosoma validum]
MRKLFFSVLLLIPFLASAQTTKPFKVNVAVGYAATADYSNSNSIKKAGFVFNLEPQYRVISNLDIGLRLEQAFVQRPEFIDESTVFQTKTKSIMSAVVTANYSINIGGSIQPFVGIGGGLYHTEPSAQSDTRFGITTQYPLPATNVAGGMARVGVRWGRLNLLADYNLVSDTQVTVSATSRALAAKNSYFSVKAGFIIGGGSDK